MKSIIFSLLIFGSISAFASSFDCNDREGDTQRALCVIEMNQAFLRTIKQNIPRRTIAQRWQFCEYLRDTGATLCGSEVCIGIPVNKKLVEEYKHIYKDVRIDGFKLKFEQTVPLCPQ